LRGALTGDQGDELQEVRDPKRRPAPRQDLEGTTQRRAGPGRREAAQLTRFIVEVDAVLAPGCAPFQKFERAPVPRVKGMGDAENPLPTERIRVSV
jgi:hypothetical protein